MHRWLAIGLIVFGLAGAIWYGYQRQQDRNLQDELVRARGEMKSGRFAYARRRLNDLIKTRGDSGEAWAMLGDCEKALGRFDEATDAWNRVAPNNPHFAHAAASYADEFVNSGRYSQAEAKLDAALLATKSRDHEVLKALTRVYRFQGRFWDVRRVLRQAALHSPNPSEDLKELWMLENSPIPVEALGRAIENAQQDDPRVMLAAANVALLRGRYDDVRAQLDKIPAAFRDDPGVRRAEFELAISIGDLASLQKLLATQKDQMGWFSPEDGPVSRARLLDRFGDSENAIEALRLLMPTDQRIWAVERLAARAAERGDSEEARRLQSEKSKLDIAKDACRDILLDGPDRERFSDLARLTATLGRPFESACWTILARDGSESWPDSPGKPEASPILPDASSAALREQVASEIGALKRLVDELIGKGQGEVAANTVSGIVAPAFVDVAGRAGLIFTFDNGASERRLLPETMSGGVGLFDYDGDGWLDVYVVQGGALNEEAVNRETDRLFRNKGDGTFEDVTESSGIASLPRGYGLAVTVGDYDNDGHPDLFLSRIRSYALFRNRGNGTFEDVTHAAGLAGVRDNPSSAAFADLDADGDIDLYVCHYMKFDPANPVICRDSAGKTMYCDPSKVVAAHDCLFRNDGGVFVDVTKESGITDENGRGLGVVAADFDDDGRTDLFVANDGTANYLFRNLGGFKFEDIGLSSGVAGNAEGGYQASMGVACGDADGDGRLDVLVTNFWGECSTLYHNLGGGIFTDWTASSGLAQATRYLLGFGTAFFDYDNDGDLDLVTANGHVNDGRPFTPFEMPPQLLANTGGGKLVDAGAPAGGVWAMQLLGRGLAVGDVDNDGRADVIILPQGAPMLLLHNDGQAGNWLALGLEGTNSNRSALGARVVVKAGGRTQTFERFGGGSYQSASDGPLLVGLGDADRVESIEVRWPSGATQQFKDLKSQEGYLLREGQAEPGALRGYSEPKK